MVPTRCMKAAASAWSSGRIFTWHKVLCDERILLAAGNEDARMPVRLDGDLGSSAHAAAASPAAAGAPALHDAPARAKAAPTATAASAPSAAPPAIKSATATPSPCTRNALPSQQPEYSMAVLHFVLHLSVIGTS